MSGFIYGKLQQIYYAQKEQRPLVYAHIGQTVRREMRFLTDSGYIEDLKIDELKDGDDLAAKVRLTPAGEWYVELRERLEGHATPAGQARSELGS